MKRHELERVEVGVAHLAEGLRRAASPSRSAPKPWLTEKFARSKKRSPMPAYSQSTMRSPSRRGDEVGAQQVVVAGRQRLLAAGALDLDGDRVRGLERGRDDDAALLGGVPVGLDDAERVEVARHLRALVDAASARGPPRGDGPAGADPPDETAVPSRKRVTSQPCGSTNRITSGPTPASAATTEAPYSHSRSMPSRCVSFPPSRSTTFWPSTASMKLRFVIPPPSSSTVTVAGPATARRGSRLSSIARS